MPTYEYKAMSQTGEKLKGVYTSNTIEEVFHMLRKNNHYPIHVEEKFEVKRAISFSFWNRIKIKDIAIFCRQFYTMLHAGISILNCLDTLRQQTQNKKFKIVIGQIYEEVQKGLTLSESLKNHKDIFPDLLIHMVETGEFSGTLDVIIARMANHYAKENKISNKVKGAMIYPIVLSIVAITVVVFLLIFVIPTFIGLFKESNTALPIPTQILLSITDIIKNYLHIIFLIFVLLIYGLKKSISMKKGQLFIDQLKLKIPIVKGTTQKIITSRFSRTLSTLLASGIPLLQALDIISEIVGNTVVQKEILIAKEDIKKGINLSSMIEKISVFPPMLHAMIRIGEESGSLDDILDETANFYDEEVEVALQKITTLIEPLMIVVMAVIVGSIIIAMLLPMIDMVNTISV
ncbi:type II secretion system F family protein [Inediibacterium massiliense]|uniref:type II secretion system F family protein n=1 Tax=Inediibacterium massiliense TaxID=1658111 RepID=UPI0006B44978|nr:type II secretion system F family protein [Inediibacterium massiliense]